VDIDLKSFRFTTVPNHDSMQLLFLVENMSRIRPIRSLFRAEKLRRSALLRATQPQRHLLEGALNFLSQSLVVLAWAKRKASGIRNYEPLVDGSLTTRPRRAFIAGVLVRCT
jgi:hypothetical protein